ncbi:rod shape-determining protein MreD [Spiractinospora alimapuensis]|uniref:rod shape-determining protein MreD n=1 Tax=Spiractinospora alimapuensis TaxID=2820884 RepID=UPI001F1ABDFB|nr:rod shape-determining protein MreD [Spiractinospora alimapuensis]QVQ51931.1 rod shape-determining protein MreD [Spiractinospora alimapuensis]
MTRSALVALMLVAAVVIQAGLINRLPFPGGTAPDLVLLVLVAAAVAVGPTTGVIAGFSTGLALDLLPPADHELGRYAILLCLVGYFAGRAHSAARRSPLLPFGVAAAAVVGVVLGDALIGVLLGDPRVTVSSVLGTLPFALGTTMLLSPFVLFAVTWVMRRSAEDEFSYFGGDSLVPGRRR